MAQSKSMKRIADALKIETYDDKEKVLKHAQEAGIGSRKAIYMALAYAYQWYSMSIGTPPYMLSKFKGHNPEIKVQEPNKNIFYVPTIKLVFDFVESQYASRVTEYALVLQYVERMMQDPVFVDAAENPHTVIDIISAGEGIRKCAETQREFNNPGTGCGASKQDVEDYLKTACAKAYKNKATISTIEIDTPKTSGYVLMMGRVSTDGEVDVLDIMDAGQDQIYSLTKDEALKDTSSLSATLNLLSDTIGYLSVFGEKDKTIVSVDKGGDLIRVSLDHNEDASVVITASPKDTDILAGFDNRASLSSKDQSWCLENVQNRATRRVYEIEQNADIDGAEMVYDLKSQVGKKITKSIHFNAMDKDTNGQMSVKKIKDDDWKFTTTFDREDIDDLYSWTKDWLTDKRPKAADRIIPIQISEKEFMLEGTGGSESKTISMTTGVPADIHHAYRVFGREFVKVTEQVWLNPKIKTMTLRAPDSGLIEIRCEDDVATYTIDIPTTLKGDVNHNPILFCKLAA